MLFYARRCEEPVLGRKLVWLSGGDMVDEAGELLGANAMLENLSFLFVGRKHF